MFHNYFKCEDILQQVGLCPQAHKVLGKLATNLTFLTYLIGRLDLTRFRLIFNFLPEVFQIAFSVLCAKHRLTFNPSLTIKALGLTYIRQRQFQLYPI